MKTFFLIIIVLVVIVLVTLFVRGRDTPLERIESPVVEHVYASWETMEFDKCVATWLIVRFIDKDARFVLYPQGTEINEGIVFDIPGAEWSRQHRKCTSDCILETLNIDDQAVERMVAIAHQIELNFWQLDRFPEAQKCFDDIRQITESTPDLLRCFEKTRKYFDELYDLLKEDE